MTIVSATNKLVKRLKRDGWSPEYLEPNGKWLCHKGTSSGCDPGCMHPRPVFHASSVPLNQRQEFVTGYIRPDLFSRVKCVVEIPKADNSTV